VRGEFRHPAAWASKAILNVARIGRFSSDRMVEEIWKNGPVEG
jgi:glucan phosphorylase